MSHQPPAIGSNPGSAEPVSPARHPGGLTPRQQRFVDEYLIDLNATRAAIRAGYSPKGADVRGCELLGNRKVAAAIQAAKDERSARCRIAADRVLDAVAAIAFSDIRNVDFDENGKLIEKTPGATRTVAACSHTRRAGQSGTTIQWSVRLWDKIGALTLLMRHFGLLDRPITLETVLAVLPPDVSSMLTRLIAEGAATPTSAAGQIA